MNEILGNLIADVKASEAKQADALTRAMVIYDGIQVVLDTLRNEETGSAFVELSERILRRITAESVIIMKSLKV